MGIKTRLGLRCKVKTDPGPSSPPPSAPLPLPSELHALSSPQKPHWPCSLLLHAGRPHCLPPPPAAGRLHLRPSARACLACLHTSLSTPGSGGVRRRAALRPFAPSVASRSLTFRPQERTRRRATASSLLSSGLQRGLAVTDTLAPATSARPARLSPAACRTSWDR